MCTDVLNVFAKFCGASGNLLNCWCVWIPWNCKETLLKVGTCLKVTDLSYKRTLLQDFQCETISAISYLATLLLSTIPSHCVTRKTIGSEADTVEIC